MKRNYILFLATLFTLCLFNSSLLKGQPILFESKGVSGGGATTQPSISPHNDSEYYITSDMHPILHSINAGESFEALPFYEFTGAGQHTKVEFTSDPNILYSFAYTGYPKPKEPIKSMDGGETWDVLPGDPTNGGVYQLFADPTSTSRVVLCGYSRIFISIDGGTSFTQIYNKDMSVYIGGIFWDGDDIYIAANSKFHNEQNEEEGEAFLLVSHDGGVNFSKEAVNGTGDFPVTEYFRHMEGVKNTDGDVMLYAVTMKTQFGGLPFTAWWGTTRRVVRLKYGDDNTWESISGEGTGMILVSDSGNENDFHPNLVATCTSAPDTLYIGGYGRPAMEVFRSIDGGDSWTKVFDGDNTNHNQNINTGWIGSGAPYFNWWWCGSTFGLDAASNNPDVVIITDMATSHQTRDGGETWSALYVAPEDLNPMGSNTPTDKSYKSNGMNITSCTDMLWISEDKLFIGYCDIQGWMSDDGGDTWNFNYNFPGNYNTTYKMIYSPDSTKLYACVSQAHDMYNNYLTDELIDSKVGEIFESSDGGINWTTTHNFEHVVMDMAIDPNNPNRFYACVGHSTEGGIHYSDDYGSTWTLLPAPPRTEGHPIEIQVLEDGTLVAVFSARYHNNQFTASSGVFISTDNGQTWEDRSDPNMHYWTMDIEIAPDNNSTWYASVYSHWGANNYAQGGVYRSFDRGITWERIKPYHKVRSISLHPEDSNVAYVCTRDSRDGLQYTGNIAAANPTFSLVSSYPFMNPEKVEFNPYNSDEVWVLSFGNGARKGMATPLVDVSGVNLFPNETTIIKSNTKQLIATVTPATALNQNITWSSSNNEIATVDENGLVTAVEQGNATIIVTTEDGGFTDSCIVTVIEPVTGITLTPNQTTIIKENTEQLTVTIAPLTATNQNVSWSSNNNDIATVDENGLVTAIEQGNATIIVTTEDGGFTDSCIVTVVEPVTGITITPNTATIIKGNTEQLTAAITPSTATNKNLTWSSNNNEIAIVDENGLITAISEGNTSIIATTEDGNFTDSCIVTVNNPFINVTGINIIPESATLDVNTTLQLTAVLQPSNATNSNITWSSNNNDVVTVNSNGLITAIASGNTAIIVTTEEGGFTDSCNVIVNNNTIDVTGLSLNPTDITLDVNTTGQLTAVLEPSNATNVDIIWNSNNNNIATVDENGLVTAIASGNTIITATTISSRFVASCNVTVNNSIINITGITVVPQSTTIDKNTTLQLTAILQPGNATNQNVSWSSTDNSIATVDENGLVTAVEQGNATITASSEDGGFSDSCIITVNNANGIDKSDNEENITLYPNPVSGLLNIESNINMHKIEVFNFLGQLVDIVNLNSKNYQYNTEKLNNGYYIFKMTTNTGTFVQKVMKK